MTTREAQAPRRFFWKYRDLDHTTRSSAVRAYKPRGRAWLPIAAPQGSGPHIDPKLYLRGPGSLFWGTEYLHRTRSVLRPPGCASIQPIVARSGSLFIGFPVKLVTGAECCPPRRASALRSAAGAAISCFKFASFIGSDPNRGAEVQGGAPGLGCDFWVSSLGAAGAAECARQFSHRAPLK